ncbi:MAG TPA: hypothetical protein VIS07_12315 [Candidatus Binatia bacterium]
MTGTRTAVLVVACLLLLAPRGALAQDAGSPGPGSINYGGVDDPDTEPLFPDFSPLPDRWRITPPPYEKNVQGHWWDPYNQNVLKGDFPILGQDIFFKLTAASKTLVEGRRVPIASGPSTARPGEFKFFGEPDQVEVDQKFAVRAELIKGNTAFRPFDWQILLEGVGDLNYLGVWERGVVAPDVRDGESRFRSDIRLEQAFAEIHLADVSANYDFISTKIGRQPFNSDFRSLIFQDINQGVRLFGSANSARYQWNVIYFYQAEKDTVSGLNTFGLRDQQVAIANLYVQDFFFLGWTNQFSFHYNFDDGKKGGYVYDRLGFLVRPTPIGDPVPHDIEAYYLGWTSEGHIGRINVSHAFYQALGTDDFNNIASRKTDINAQLGFLELSIDDDWLRYQVSTYITSGDGNARDSQATGFDSILDNPKVVGGEYTWWNRQAPRISDRGGAALVQRLSLVPDLRSNKIQGQSNFVNPGIFIANVGVSAEMTPKLRLIGNANYIRFMETDVLETLLKQGSISNDVGIDLSLGIEYRPWLNNNVIVKGFGAILQPLDGFSDIYTGQTLWQMGVEMLLVF